MELGKRLVVVPDERVEQYLPEIQIFRPFLLIYEAPEPEECLRPDDDFVLSAFQVGSQLVQVIEQPFDVDESGYRDHLLPVLEHVSSHSAREMGAQVVLGYSGKRLCESRERIRRRDRVEVFPGYLASGLLLDLL